MRLAGFEHLLAAGRRGQWDAEAIDLAQDAGAFGQLDAAARDRIARLVAGFCVAECAVAEHLRPFGVAVADPVAAACFALQEGDERRHARFFARVAAEVIGGAPDPRALAGPEIVGLFEESLPALAARLAAGEAELGEAVALYHLVLEGIVFAIGQDALVAELDAAGILPGVRAGVIRVQADERWHVGLGVLCLQQAGALSPELEPLAARAASAWGPEIATPERTSRVLAVHRRRTMLLAAPARR